MIVAVSGITATVNCVAVVPRTQLLLLLRDCGVTWERREALSLSGLRAHVARAIMYDSLVFRPQPSVQNP